jgi:hypothetical protein
MSGVIVSGWSSCGNAIFWKCVVAKKTAKYLRGKLVVVIIIKLQIA